MPVFGQTRAALAAAAARGADILSSLRLVMTAEALTAPVPAQALELNTELEVLCDACRELAACRGGWLYLCPAEEVQPAALPRGLLHGVVQCLKHRRLDEVIGVHNADVITAGIVQPGVAGVGRASVGLVEHTDAGILPGQRIADLGRAIVAAVIHQQQLKIGEGLGQNTFHRRAQVGPGVVDGGDYADFGMVRHRYFLISY